MKKQFNHSSAFLDPHLRIGLFAFLAGIVAAMFGDAFAQQRQTRPTRTAGQKHNVKAAVQRPDQGFWAQTNGPQGGDGIALATNASGHVFVGTQGGGIFRSTDNVETWTGVNSGLTATNVRALAINAVSGHIFAGTFSGVFRSTDNGDSWIPVNNGLEFPSVISLAINSSGDIFAGTFEGGGVYRSTDNGDNWTLIDNGLTNTYVTALAINSSDNIFAATFGGGAFRSTNNGGSWTALNTGVPNATFLSLAINASGYIFAGGDPLGGPVGVLRSTDNGDSWEPVNNGLNTGNGINALIATPNGYLFAGSYGDGVFRSTDDGDNWAQVNNDLTAVFVLSFATNSVDRPWRYVGRKEQWFDRDRGAGNWDGVNTHSTSSRPKRQREQYHFCRNVRDRHVSIER